MTILDDIVASRQQQVEELKRTVPLAALQERIQKVSKPRNFEGMLRGSKVRVIAEVKRASPSHGPFEQLYDARILAQEYAGNGAAAVSCVTEPSFFDGDDRLVHRARYYMPLPVLRKDFIVDDYQVYEARAIEADAILLIVAILSDLELRLLSDLARKLGMGVLVETHDGEEVRRALNAGARIIGVNNRNLKTMKVDLAHTEAVAELVPGDRILVSESGINSREDVERLAACGVDAILVGSLLMRNEDPGHVLRPLTAVDSRPGRHSRP
jgi:indole-3-glycerol phosphate synthase